MRPLGWGIALFIVGLFGWIVFSVIAGIQMATEATVNPVFTFLVYFFGTLAFFSLPVAFLIEIINFIKKKFGR